MGIFDTSSPLFCGSFGSTFELSQSAVPLSLISMSIILADSQMEEQDNVEQCIASIKAHQLGVNSSDLNSDVENGDKLNTNSPGQVAGKRSKRSHTGKVFHNDNSVIIKHLPPTVQKRKLRAKDFKWSHYIKSMRYWCSDCAHGFRNQREVASHTEEKCKWNCLYMLECYVIVKDAQYHAHYGPKVSNIYMANVSVEIGSMLCHYKLIVS